MNDIKACGDSQSQRDCVIQPRVARNELPWVSGRVFFNPNGVVPRLHQAATPLWLFALTGLPRVARSSHPLGFGSESRWDSSQKSKAIIKRNSVFDVPGLLS